MSHVSCRLYTSLLDLEKSHGISIEDGLAGIDVPREYMENPHNWIEWKDFVKISKNYYRMAGGDEEHAKMQASCVPTTEGLAYLRTLCSFALSPAMLYRQITKHCLDKLYKPVSCSFDLNSDGTIRLVVSIDNAFEDCREHLIALPACVEVFPLLIGLPKARVESSISVRRGEYRIFPPKSRTLWAHFKRFFVKLFKLRSASGMLQEQNEKLMASFEALERQSNGFQSMLETLQDGVAVLREGKIIYANASLSNLLGLDRLEELMGDSLERWVLALEEKALREWLLGDGSEDELREFHFPGPRENPAIVEVSSPRPLIWGENPAKMVLLRDVSEKRRVTDRIVQATHREQQRIARDLHDGLGQELAAVALKAKVLENELKPNAEEPVASLSAELVSLAREASVRARDISHSLAPVDIAPEGLEEMLRRLLRTTAQLFGFDYSFLSSSCEGLRVAPEASMQLYRAIQEALTNAHRHGKASHVALEVERNDGYLRLGIEDDGVGLPENFDSGASDGMGLEIMRHRIVSLGGHFSLANRADGKPGLQVRFEIPLAKSIEKTDEKNRFAP